MGYAAYVGTGLMAAPIWVVTSLAMAARFVRNPVRYCRRVHRRLEDFPDGEPGLEHRTFDVGGGVRLHAATAGLGSGRQLLLLLHGFPETWHSWRHQIAALRGEYEVVALDMRGFGLSDAPRGAAAYRMGRLCADVAAVVRAAGHASCALVAHDWGGAVAWCFAAAHPGMVDRLAVLCSPHPAAFADPTRFDARQARRSWYFLLFMARGLPEAWLRARDFERLDTLFLAPPFGARAPGAVARADVDRLKAALARPGSLSAAVNYYRASMWEQAVAPSVEAVAAVKGKLKMPVLVLYADRDGAFCPHVFAGMEAHAEDVRTVELPDCSHWAQQDRPELVNAHLRRFLLRPDGEPYAPGKAAPRASTAPAAAWPELLAEAAAPSA